MQFIHQLKSLASGAILGAALIVILNSGAPHAVLSAPNDPPVSGEASCDSGRSVRVSGAATINVTPDRVSVKLGVETNAPGAEEVQRKNAAVSQSVIKAIRTIGIPAKDISTDYYMVQPVYESYDSLTIKGYRIYNTIGVVLKDAAKNQRAAGRGLQSGCQ